MNKKAFIHVDMDSLESIYEVHSKKLDKNGDDFYLTAVDNSIDFFDEFGVKATYFVVARDLEIPVRKTAIQKIVGAGHNVASHSVSHRFLRDIPLGEKKTEVVRSKQMIEDATGTEVLGFRAPSYSIDYDVIQILGEAGYRYDSSISPDFKTRSIIQINRLFQDPFVIAPSHNLIEIPMPSLEPIRFPFHPSYSFVLSRFWHNFGLKRFASRWNYMTYLFHLADFSEIQNLDSGLKIKIFANDRPWARKQRFLRTIFKPVLNQFEAVKTEDFVLDWPKSAPELTPRITLGISATHETAACITKNGEVLAAVSEERLSRIKLDATYPPVKAIAEVIRVSGVEPKDIDSVAIAGLDWRALIPQSVESQKQDFFDYHAFIDYIPHFCKIFYRFYYFARACQYGDLSQHLAKRYGIEPKVFHVEHHEAHAWSAYACGGVSDAIVLTADGVGDDISVTMSHADGRIMRRVYRQFYPHSFGQFYTALTQYLGFKGGRHEGKVTGLASYGEASSELMSTVERTLVAGDGFKLNKRYYSEGIVRGIKFSMLVRKLTKISELFRESFGSSDTSFEYRNYKKPLTKILEGHSREELANAYQRIIERELTKIVKKFSPNKPIHLCAAGGVMANVKLNQALSRNVNTESIFIFPNMGDGGLSVGAAFALQAPSPVAIKDVYWGAGPTAAECLAALEKEQHNLKWERPANLAETAAKALADGKVVARHDGRMEFGPRALGNRSILYHCSDASVNDWLNRQLKRSEFMPFAPICLYEDALKYFEIRDSELYTCQFMTLVVHATELMKEKCPAAVHVDGTCRPQLIKKETNPELHELLKAYKKLTEISCIINTSFNMHEEPIVNAPDDGVRAFLAAGLDVLILGPYLAKHSRV